MYCKVHWLTKMLSWNVTKWGLFFNFVSLMVHTLLPLVLQCCDHIGQESHQPQIWHHPMNFSAHSCKYIYIYIYICIKWFFQILIEYRLEHVRVWKLFEVNVSKVGDRIRGWPEGSLFNSFYTKMLGRALLLSLDCSTLPLIHTL